jgi:hypothetical protein
MSAATPPDINTTTDEELLFCLLMVQIPEVLIRVCADLPGSNIRPGPRSLRALGYDFVFQALMNL